MLKIFRNLILIEILVLMVISVLTIVSVMLEFVAFNDTEMHKDAYFILTSLAVVIFHVGRVLSLPSSSRMMAFIGGSLCIAFISAVWLTGTGIFTAGFRTLFGIRGIISSIILAIAWPFANSIAALLAGNLVNSRK